MNDINELYQRLLQSYTQGQFYIILLKSLLEQAEKTVKPEEKPELIFDLQEINILCSVDREKILKLEKLLSHLVTKYKISELSLQEDDITEILNLIKIHYKDYEQQRSPKRNIND